MEPNIKDNGLTIRLKERVNLPMLMEIFMTDNGKKIKLLDMEFTFITMVQDIKVIGSMIINMVMVLRLGLMVVNMRETTKKERKTEKVNTLGKTEVFTRETGLIIKSLDMENMSGLTEGPILETGSTIKCMEKVSIHGKMEENIKVSISLTKNTGSVLILGKMAESTLENGKIVNVMEEEK